MMRSRITERRRDSRYQESSDILIEQLPEVEGDESVRHVRIPGRIQNIGQGGMCVTTSERLKVSALVRCEIRMYETEIRVPTLMQVRWTKERSEGQTAFVAGLATLL